MKKVCFPVLKDEGLESQVYDHFGSAPLFIVVDRDTMTHERLQNADLHHQHGQCNPMKALNNNSADAVVVGGIGGGALKGLQFLGIKVFKSAAGTVRENLDMLLSGRLKEMTNVQACDSHHGTLHHLGRHGHGHDCCSVSGK